MGGPERSSIAFLDHRENRCPVRLGGRRDRPTIDLVECAEQRLNGRVIELVIPAATELELSLRGPRDGSEGRAAVGVAASANRIARRPIFAASSGLSDLSVKPKVITGL